MKKDLLSISAGVATTLIVVSMRRSLRLRMAAGILLGHPVMYRMKIHNGTLVIDRSYTKVVDSVFINDKPDGTAIQLSMN